MRTDPRLYQSDAERHALNLLRAGYWVRLRPAPADSDVDHQVDYIVPVGSILGDEQGRG